MFIICLILRYPHLHKNVKLFGTRIIYNWIFISNFFISLHATYQNTTNDDELGETFLLLRCIVCCDFSRSHSLRNSIWWNERIKALRESESDECAHGIKIGIHTVFRSQNIKVKKQKNQNKTFTNSHSWDYFKTRLVLHCKNRERKALRASERESRMLWWREKWWKKLHKPGAENNQNDFMISAKDKVSHFFFLKKCLNYIKINSLWVYSMIKKYNQTT